MVDFRPGKKLKRKMEEAIEPTAKEQLAKEQAIREQRTKEQATKEQPTKEHIIKIIVIGDVTTGKTSFVQRFIHGTFQSYKPTMGVDFGLKVVRYSEDLLLKVQLWDISGQERFTAMTRVYFKDAVGCLILFDLANKVSFDNTVRWKRDVDTKCALSNGDSIPVLLLANKCDIERDKREVERSAIEDFVTNTGFDGWIETSAKYGLMIDDSVQFLLEKIMERLGRLEAKRQEDDVINLQDSDYEKEKSCKC